MLLYCNECICRRCLIRVYGEIFSPVNNDQNHKRGLLFICKDRLPIHQYNIETFWSTFKCGIIGIYHKVSPKHLHRYTTEFGYRYNNRTEIPNIKFEDAITGANKKTLTYQKLIGGVTNQTLNQTSTTFAEKKPDQNFLDLLDNADEENS